MRWTPSGSRPREPARLVRNVTGCPLAGVAADELIDAAPLAAEISQLLKGNPDFYNLPRNSNLRHRLSIVVLAPGDQRHCSHGH